MRHVRLWSLVILGIICALVLLFVGMLNPLTAVMRQASLPLAHWFSGMGGGLSSSVPDEVKTLQERVATLAVDYAKLKALEDENKALRAQAKFLFSSGFDSVGARVIGRELRSDRALLLIDRGLDDHVEIGQAVVAGDGIFIGKISQLKEKVATVELLTDPLSRVAASFSDDGRLMGVVEGRGNGTAVMTYIPAAEIVKKDRIIITSGTDSKFSTHLPLGIVNEVLGKPTDPFTSAILEPLTPLDQVMFVSILRPTALSPGL